MANKILSEIKQQRPFATVQEEGMLNIARTADYLERQSELLFKQYELTRTQYNVLRILRGAGDAGTACRDISERMITTDPDITRLLDRLEKRELIARYRVVGDRRIVKTRITPSGVSLLKKLEKPVRELQARLLAPLNEEEIYRLITLLERLRV